ncbi:Hint domain-containing protein [Tritonibacter mobilis]|uniref:Hint domain-containing protein n=1 Tax=Tritonibacter mobilis TaxID=379347 RepID=UPI000806B15B|nr:Hint domain-containing protein [Tritonibacter mobilis]GLP88684.1 hemolysin [Tritonibacter mobilis]SDX41828.1 Hint domain-containing protein [Tritonibacter mobilis]
MADYVINADSFGSFYKNVGQNGSDDTVTVNISSGFRGAITVDSQPADGEIDETTVIIPEGWELRLVSNAQDDSVEDPAFNDLSYEVYNTAGEAVGTLSIRSNGTTGVPCFLKGTMIDTPRGAVPIEQLQIGDFVLTKDRGAQPIRWIGSRNIGAADLEKAPNLRPIRITAGALGFRLPATDLIVSPQHRVLLRSRVVQNMFGVGEVMVAAKKLLALKGIEIASDLSGAHYYHFLCDRHEVVVANGAETESLFPGPEALRSVGAEALAEIYMLFPELQQCSYTPVSARPFPGGRQAQHLAERHLKNNKSLVCAQCDLRG